MIGVRTRQLPCYSRRTFYRVGDQSRSKQQLFEATTMSQTCATKKSIAPFRTYSDFLKRGGVYEKTDRITSILPGNLGNGKNPGG
jgi:hypothetical protein